jgi:zinc transporter ZupT
MNTSGASLEARTRSRALRLASGVLPLVFLGAILALLFARGTGLPLHSPAPLEKLDFERVVLRPGLIEAHVLNSGAEPVTITQAQVGWLSRASWEFEVRPEGEIPRLGRAVVTLPYPWTPGEPYEIVLISANGLIFSHHIPIAAETPAPDRRMLGAFALLGIYVGVIPVFLGILWLPFLRGLPPRGYAFLLSLTAGLLVFLGVDALEDALESAERVPAPFQGVAVILMGASLSLLGLYAVSGWLRRRSRAAEANPALLLAYAIAFGIGVHNLGEGLAIGGAYALGEFATTFLLIVGFMVHNLTEGVAVVAPVVRTEFRWTHLLWLGLLAGAPTIAGTLVGAFAYTPVWAVLFLAVGAGAVFQVVIEITRHQLRQGGFASVVSGASLAGFAAGLLVMYVTGLFVTI